MVTVGKFIAKNERLYASQKWRVVWVLRIYVNAMRLCWLIKQVWRLIHDIDSIFYKVFKAKYFHRCSLFEAKVSFGSFAWKSILHSRKVVSLGAKWRIRDGSQS